MTCALRRPVTVSTSAGHMQDLLTPGIASLAVADNEPTDSAAFDVADVAWLTNPTDYKSPRQGRRYVSSFFSVLVHRHSSTLRVPDAEEPV